MKWMYFSLAAQLLLVGSITARPGQNEEPSQSTLLPSSIPSSIITSTTQSSVTATTQQIVTESKSIGPNITEIVAKRRNQEVTQTKSDPNAAAILNNDQIVQSQNIPFTAALSTIRNAASEGKSHQGIAVPVSMEDIERELAAAEMKPNDSSTSKDGISTWILLSGTHSTAQPDMAKGPAYKIENNQKIDKIAKVRDVPPKQQQTRVPAVSKTELLKNKSKSKITTTTTSAATTTTTPEPEVTKPLSKSQQMKKKQPLHEMLPEPVPLIPTTSIKTKHKTTVSVDNSVISISSKEESGNDESAPENNEITIMTTQLPPTTKEIPVPFLILEPKDADFDLPQDRSPGKTTKKPKRPVNKTNKKKTTNKKTTDKVDDLKNGTKVANKLRDKPMSTKIYNYLSREVMPTVGVGLIGLVVTAGLAGYFFGPLGALRRSYEVADRKDDLYYYNNEEYAGPGADGQSEEEIFGKVIAGMPTHSNNYRNNVRYAQTQQRPNQFHQGGPHKYVQQHQPQQQQAQYNRYRTVVAPQHHQQHPSQVSYSVPSHHVPANHAHQRMGPAGPNVISQKSISSPIFALQSSSAATTGPITTSTTSTTIPDSPNIIYSTQTEHTPPEKSEEPAKSNDDFLMTADNPNELKRRSQFVVGSVLPESIDPAAEDSGVTVVIPEHGPRRRRRRSISTVVNPQKSLESDIKLTEDLYKKLKHRVEKTEKNDKINKEMKHLEYEMIRLTRIVAEIKDIEQFQNELRIVVKNSELRDTVTNGVAQINSDIKFVNELLDTPREINQKIANRIQMTKTIDGKQVKEQEIIKKSDSMPLDVSAASSLTSTSTISTPTTTNANDYYYDYTTTQRPSGFLGLLKLLELKATFGVNILRSIRPAFDRAFQEVFKVNQTQTQLTNEPANSSGSSYP